MKNGSETSAPWHMWVVGALLLLVYGLANCDYIATVIRYEPYLANIPEETLTYYFNTPLWMYVVWGIANFGGLVSAILLLMRRSAAAPVFAIAWLSSAIAAAYHVANPAPIGGSNLFLAAFVFITLLILIYMHGLKRRGVLR